MPTTAKIQKVDEVTQKLKSAKSSALLQYQGLNAADVAALRDSIRENGGQMEVIKNSLITRALLKMGIKLPEVLSGPTAITFCNEDEIAPLKIIDKVNKDKELTSFKYGLYDGKLLTLDELKKFITLPSKSALIAQLLGGLVNPLQRLAYIFRYNQQQLALTLKALETKKSSAN